MAKMYWFSMSKYSHDLFFRMNRLKNTIDDMVMGENEVDWDAIAKMEQEVEDIQEIFTYGGNGAVQLPARLYGVAKNASIWAREARANTCIANGRKDLVRYC